MNGNHDRKIMAKVQTALLPTPMGNDREGSPKKYMRGNPNLAQAILLPTPTVAGNYNRKGASETSADGLATAINRFLPTPSAMEMASEGKGEKFITSTGTVRRRNADGTSSNLGLSHTIAMLPTPTACDYKGSSARTEIKGRKFETNRLCDAVERGRTSGLKLQPSFALWMMGYPPDWCDLKDGE